MFKKNTAARIFFCLVKASDGTALTGATVTARRALDGGSQATATGTVSELANGQYRFDADAADLNGDDVGLLFTAATAVPVAFSIRTVTKLVSELNDVAAGAEMALVSDAITAAKIENGAIADAKVDAAIARQAKVDTLHDDRLTAARALAIDNLDAAVSDAVVPAIAAAIAAESVDGKLTTARAEKLDVVSTFDAGEDTVQLASAERDAIAAALLDLADGVETSHTVRQALRLVLAATAGKLSGAATTEIKIRDMADSKDRITATVDEDGNRVAVVRDAT